MTPTGVLTGFLKLLADPTRLRIAALLDREELAVGELGRALGMAQSRVSNHLRLLREAGLLSERHAGTSTFVRLAQPAGAANGAGAPSRLWSAVREELDGLPEHAADLLRLRAVLDEREQDGDFFDRLAGSWDKIAGDFESGQARQRAAAHLLPAGYTVADLGCGAGTFGHALAGPCDRLICVDRSQGMLQEAEKRLVSSHPGTSIELRQGRLTELPIADGEVNGVVCGLVLHHLPELDAPLAEMRRALAPGGAAVVVELAPHREAWMREELGDRHLGLEPSDVVAAFGRAGFEDVVLEPLQDRYRPSPPGGEPVSLPLYLVRGRVPRT